MARRKTPVGETPEQQQERRIKETVANSSSRGEKTSWNRKLDNMVKLLAKLAPIEEQIIDLQAQKMPIFDEVQELRSVMVNECVHPLDYLTVNEDHVLCKFCNRRIGLPDGK